MTEKLQPIDLISALQMAQRNGGSNDNSTLRRLMEQEALKQEKIKSLLAQNEFEQQTSVPTITVPGVMASGGSMGGAYKVPITDLPGQVSGQAAPTYGQQVHEGNMQTGRLMADMAQTAATSGARVGASEARGPNQKESQPNAWRGYGEYPIAALLASQSAHKPNTPPIKDITNPKINYDPNAVLAAQQYQASNQGTPYNSPNDVKNVADINKDNTKMLKGQAQAEEKAKKEATKIATVQAKDDAKTRDVATRQARVAELGKTLSGDPTADKQTLSDMARIAKVTVSELINSEMYRNLTKKK